MLKLLFKQLILIVSLIFIFAFLSLGMYIFPDFFIGYKKDFYLLSTKIISFYLIIRFGFKMKITKLFSNYEIHYLDCIRIFLFAITYSFLVDYLLINSILGKVYTSNNLTPLKAIEVIVITPILEEVLFRHIIQKNFNQNMEFLFSIIMTSVLFSIYHGNIEYIFSYFIFSVVIGLIYNKYNSLGLCVFFHSLNNLGVFIIYNL